MLAEGRRERLVCSQWRALCRTALWRARDFSAGSRAPVGVWCDPYVPLIALNGHPKRRQLVRRLFSLANFSCQILLTGELNSLPSRVMILHAFWAWCLCFRHIMAIFCFCFVFAIASVKQSVYLTLKFRSYSENAACTWVSLICWKEHQTRTLWMEEVWRSIPPYRLWSMETW